MFLIIIKIAILSLLTLIMLLTINDFLNIYFLKRYRRSRCFFGCLYLGYFILSMCLYLFQVPPVINIIFNVIVLLCITAGYEAALSNRIFISMFIVSFMVCVEIFVPYVFSLFFREPIGQLLQNEVMSLYMISSARLLPFMAVKLYKIYADKKGYHTNKKNYIMTYEWIFMVMLPLGSIVLMTFLFQTPSVSNINIALTIFIILVLNITFYHLYNRILEAEQFRTSVLLLEKQMDYYNVQYEELKDRLQENKIIKHDLKHNLINIFSRLRDKNWDIQFDGVENEMDKMLNDIFCEKYICYSNHSSLDMILNHMIHRANKRGVQTEVNVNIYDRIYIDGKVLCVIVGNALENAIEACEEDGQKNIKVNIMQQNANLYIDVSNPYSEEITFADDLPQTKKEDNQLHGFGLKSMKKLVDENGGYLQITTDNKIFRLQILLKNKSFMNS